jgi:hypothetical protein
MLWYEECILYKFRSQSKYVVHTHYIDIAVCMNLVMGTALHNYD